jgi:hypothetical protein
MQRALQQIHEHHNTQRLSCPDYVPDHKLKKDYFDECFTPKIEPFCSGPVRSISKKTFES